jgi:hypothetical protein
MAKLGEYFMSPTLVKAHEWSEVEEIASKLEKCIRPEKGSNWARAKQTWDVYAESEDVMYFLEKDYAKGPSKGYLRLLRVSGFYKGCSNSTYIVDFVIPSCHLLPLMVARQMAHTILCKSFSGPDSIWSEHWPKIKLAFPKLDMYPYHNQGASESDWLIVMK